MVFSSNLFIFRFIPVVFLLLFLTPKKHQNLVLLISSLFFYAWGEVRYIFIMIASIIVDYTMSNSIEKYRNQPKKTKVFLYISIFFNLGMLFFFKYTNFFITNINMLFQSTLTPILVTLPLGISFYTFQTMSYTIDVYRNKIKADKNIIDFGAYVCLFPQLIAGPIIKYRTISHQLKHRMINSDNVVTGTKIFLLGLFSKVLLANNIGMLWDEVQTLTTISTITAWLGLVAFALQIYFDFSGYSLMAIGLGKILGFDFEQNFNFPYISKSMSEFWSRWHMTLGAWFKEYVYIPLGGNKKGKPRQMLNLLIVWFLTGFWHGANYNFILWGLYFFVLLTLEKLFFNDFLNKHSIIARVYFVFFILIGWAIFAIDDITQLTNFIQVMFSYQQGSEWLYYLKNYGIILICGLIFSTPIIKKVVNRFEHSYALELLYVVGFIVSVAYLVDSTYNPFLYFRF